MPPSTATQRALRVPEILHQIFEESSSGDQARIAQVCKTWFSIAVGLIWKRMPDVHVLLCILAPLAMKDDKVVFTRALTAQDWVRFDVYAGRVRELHQHRFCARPLHPDLMLELLVTRPPSELLPRLRDLHLHTCTLNCASLFLHTSITSLNICLKGSFPLLGPLLASLPMKTPGLEKLSLQEDGFYSPEASVEGFLATAIHGLPSLASLCLPPFWLTSPIAKAAASAPALRDLAASFTVAEEMPLAKSSEFKYLMSTSLPADGFPALTSLTVPTTFSRATQVLLQGDHFNKLARFQIISPRIESPNAYEAMLAVLSACCPGLEYLSISVIPIEPASYEPPAITFNDIKPVIRLMGLQHLHLHHPTPFQIDTENVITIARALPCITTLSLNPAPNLKGTSTLGVGVLSPLLSFFPDINKLGLYLNTSDKHIPSPERDEEYRQVVLESGEFTGLAELNVGKTSISSPIQLAIYLSRVLPPHCAIEACVTSDDNPDEDDEDEERVVDDWAEIVRLIPAFQQVRAEGSCIPSRPSIK